MGDLPPILLTNRIFFDGQGALAAELDGRLPAAPVLVADTDKEARRRLSEATVAVTHRFPTDWLSDAELVEWIQALSAGVDFYDVAALDARDIALTTASGVHAEPAGEHALGAVLYFERKFDEALARQADREWERYFPGTLAGRTVGIVGLGSIGGCLAALCSELGMAVLGTKRDLSLIPDAVDEAYLPD